MPGASRTSVNSAWDSDTATSETAMKTDMNPRTVYRDYLLSCEPMRQDDGRYQARVVITSMGGEQTRSQRFIDLGAFDSEDVAVEHARRSGMDWIDINHPPC
jgi:hypothetical protein